MYGRIKSGLVGVLALAAMAGSAWAQAAPADYQRILQDKGPAFVTVRFVLQVKMGGAAENESETEIGRASCRERV